MSIHCLEVPVNFVIGIDMGDKIAFGWSHIAQKRHFVPLYEKEFEESLGEVDSQVMAVIGLDISTGTP